MTKFLAALLLTALALPALEPNWSGIITLERNPLKQPPKAKSPLLVVNDQKAYEKFLARIPAKQISRTRPAPANNDPIRKRPKIDFTINTLLIAIRPSMAKPVIQSVKSNEKETTVTVKFPRENFAARPLHIGVYTALLVPKVKPTVRLKLARR